MSRILELIGLGLIAGTVYAFLGLNDSELKMTVFYESAGGDLAIIIYRNSLSYTHLTLPTKRIV